KVGREAFVERDHWNVGDVAQRLDEAFRLAGLLSAVAAEGKRKPDHDAVDLMLTDQCREPGETVTGRGLFDDAERPRNRAGRVRDGDAGACPAVVECENLHFSAAAIACFPASSAPRNPAGFLPPASPSVG